MLVSIEVEEGATAREAIEASGIQTRFPELKALEHGFGIYGQRAQDDTLLVDGDRVDIYCPLLVDPKEARRRRAEAKKRRDEGKRKGRRF